MKQLFYRVLKDNGKIEIKFIEENGEIQLCTGEKDKNGEYIYEGDMVRFQDEDGESIGVVRFFDGEFQIEKISGNDFYDYDGRLFDWHQLEVIKKEV